MMVYRYLIFLCVATNLLAMDSDNPDLQDNAISQFENPLELITIEATLHGLAHTNQNDVSNEISQLSSENRALCITVLKCFLNCVETCSLKRVFDCNKKKILSVLDALEASTSEN